VNGEGGHERGVVSHHEGAHTDKEQMKKERKSDAEVESLQTFQHSKGTNRDLLVIPNYSYRGIMRSEGGGEPIWRGMPRKTNT